MMRRLMTIRVCCAVLVALVVAAWVVGGFSRVTIGSGVDSALPSGDASVSSLEDMAESFGGDPIVVLLESDKPNRLLGKDNLPGLLSLEGELAQLPDAAVTYGPATTLNQTVIRIQTFLSEISGRRDGLREAGRDREAAEFDKRYGALVVRGLPAGLPTLRNPAFVDQVVYGGSNTPRANWAQFVPDRTSVAVYVRPREGLDQDAAGRLTAAVKAAAENSSVDADRVTVTGAPTVTAELAERAQSELPRLGVAALAAVAAGLLLVPWTSRRRRLLPLVPMVVATLMTLAWFGWRGGAVSLGAVAFLPVILGLGSYYPVYLAQTEHRRRVLAVAGAAAAAFGTLTLSPLPFVRDLGQAIALGIALVVASSLALTLVPGWRTPRVESAEPVPPANRRGVGMAVLGLLTVVACTGWAVLPRVSVETDPQRLIAGLESFEDANHAESVIGFSGEVDVVLTGPDVTSPQALRWLREAQQGIVTKHGDQLRPIVSPTDLLAFLGPDPTKDEIDAALDLLPQYVSGAAFTPDRSHAVISLGGQWDALTHDHNLLRDVRTELPDTPEGYSAELAGLPVAANRGYELVSGSRLEANVTGIAVAGLVLLLALRRRRDAWVAVSAAALATGLCMFVAWAAGLSLNPLTLALGPLAAATGCEFAVLLAAARRAGDRGLRRSVWLAAALSAAGYGVLGFSGLSVVREFGIALVISVGFALLSAVVVTSVLPGRRPDPAPGEPLTQTLPRRDPETVGAPT